MPSKTGKKYAVMMGSENDGSEAFLPDNNNNNNNLNSNMTSSTSSSNHNNSNNRKVALYDMEAMLQLKSQIACGYITLLTGGVSNGSHEMPPKQKTRSTKQEEDDLCLAFAALTNGNVIDACFGAKNGGGRTNAAASEQCQRLIRNAKGTLEGLADDNDHLPEIAVAAYRDGLQAVVDAQAKFDKLNFITRCFFYGRLYREAVQEIQQAFTVLEKAIQEASPGN